MFTSGQVATMLELPPSTLRRYVGRYAASLSDSSRNSRSRRFTDGDVVILKRVRELLSAGKSQDEVEAMLAVVDVAVVDAPVPATVLELIPAIGQELASTRQLARTLQLQVDDVTDRLASIEAYLSTPWWKRPFVGRPKSSS